MALVEADQRALWTPAASRSTESLALPSSYKQQSGGFSYFDGKWQFDSTVVKDFTEYPPEKVAHDITLNRYVARMSDYNDYQVHVLTPNGKKQETDVPVAFTTALGTSDRGHNRRTAIQIAEMGYIVYEIGPEGNYNPGLVETIRRVIWEPDRIAKQLLELELARTAHNIHQILDANIGNHLRGSIDQIALVGESRGDMVGTGVVAFAEAHKRKVLFSNLIAGCFFEGFDWKDAKEYGPQLVNEVVSFAKLVSHFTLRRASHYHDTINLNPKALINQLAYIPTLLSGQTGELAQVTPRDSQMYIGTFTGDKASQGTLQSEIFEDYPGVIVDSLDGTHITLAEQRILREGKFRLEGLLNELIRNQDNGSDIDYEKVHLGPMIMELN